MGDYGALRESKRLEHSESAEILKQKSVCTWAGGWECMGELTA